MTTVKPALTAILEALARAAFSAPGHPQRKQLKSGLSIDLICGLDGVIRMQIWREHTLPSDTELKTVLDYWSVETCGHPAVAKGSDGKYIAESFAVKTRRYLRVAWPVEAKA